MNNDDDLETIILTNGTATSGGNGPGMVRVPHDEATRWVNARMAVRATAPPVTATHMARPVAEDGVGNLDMSDHEPPCMRQHLPERDLTPADADWWRKVG